MKTTKSLYNYDDYHIELLQKLREMHQVAYECLIKKKAYNDQLANLITIHIGDQVFYKIKLEKVNLTLSGQVHMKYWKQIQMKISLSKKGNERLKYTPTY